MTLVEELRAIVIAYAAPEIEDVKARCIEAARNGHLSVTLPPGYLSAATVSYLVKEGLTVDTYEGKIAWK